MFIPSFCIFFVSVPNILLVGKRPSRSNSYFLSHHPFLILSKAPYFPVWQSCTIRLWDSVHLSHAPVKSSSVPLMKIPVFPSVAPGHTNSTSSSIIPILVSAPAHCTSGKELNPFSQEGALISSFVLQ